MRSQPTVVDLFCGCGGFGLGAELAGFKTIVAVDIDDTLRSAYELNLPNTNVVRGDLGKMDDDTWRLLLQEQQVDAVIGGPPCQGFSAIGTRDPKDPRRRLLTDFFRHVNILQPKFFVMENVGGLLEPQNLPLLESAISTIDGRYTVLKPFIVDASKFGAPTKRKRVIIVGYDANELSPIHEEFLLETDAAITTVRDAIDDISGPLTESAIKNDFGWKGYRPRRAVSDYANMMRAPAPKGLGSKLAAQMLAKGKVSGNFNTLHSETVATRYNALAPGQVDKTSRSKRLEWGGLCPTLRAGTGSEKGGYQAVRPIHPSEPRVITVREAARLQGFPDWYCFHPTKWNSFRMIGNSVSPIVSKALLSKLRQLMEQKEKQRKRA